MIDLIDERLFISLLLFAGCRFDFLAVKARVTRRGDSFVSHLPIEDHRVSTELGDLADELSLRVWDLAKLTNAFEAVVSDGQFVALHFVS